MCIRKKNGALFEGGLITTTTTTTTASQNGIYKNIA